MFSLNKQLSHVVTRQRAKKMRWLVPVGVISVLLCTAVAFLLYHKTVNYSALEPFLSDEFTVELLTPLESEDGAIMRYSVELSRGKAKAWVFSDGSVFWCEESAKEFELNIYDFASKNATHLNKEDLRSPLLIEGESRSALIQPPLAREEETLNGANYIAVNENNGNVTYDNATAKIQFGGGVSDWWVYLTPGSLTKGAEDKLDWLLHCSVEKFGDKSRMTTHGYYYTTPQNYSPSGENCFYRLPAAHIASKLARRSNAHHGHQIAIAMLDIQTTYYNDNGYIPTTPLSRWLYEDYGIEAGFYDTRFNTDVAHALLTLGKEKKVEEFTYFAMLYANFLVRHATGNSASTENGLLVDDYSHINGNKPTHSSLNHQLAEILFLLETQNEECVNIAEKMLKGIEDTAKSWICGNGDLYYARYADGTFGGKDYPCLTYNDLLALDNYLGGNAALKELMNTKRIWMDKNGITEYDK